jgi:hypothetical protein
MNLQQRTDALLALVEQYRAARCAQLLAPAQAQADAILRGARGDARRRVHTTVTEERRRLARDVTAAQARLATERRVLAQRRAKLLLGAGWSALRAALQARWSDPAARRTWIASHLNRALSALPHGGDVCWRVLVPAGLPRDERAALLAGLSASGVTRATCDEDPSVDAGLRVVAGANVLDASLDGLLADRATLEGRLLQAVAPEAPAPHEQPAPALEPT